MDDREEITKRLLKVFLPFAVILIGLFVYASSLDNQVREGLEVKAISSTDPLDKAEAPPRSPATPAPSPETSESAHQVKQSTTNTTVTLRDDAADLFEQLDDQTLDLLDEVEGDLEGNALQRMQAGLKLVTQLNDNSVKAIAAETLQTVLPDDLPGWTAGKITAKSTSMLGIHTSMARRSYTDAKGRKAFIKLMDTASMKRVSALGAVATGSAEIVTETDEYIEKTIMIGEIPAYAKYAKKTQSVKIHAFTHGRFIIEANSNDLSIDELAARVAALKLGLLDGFIPAAEDAPDSEQTDE